MYRDTKPYFSLKELSNPFREKKVLHVIEKVLGSKPRTSRGNVFLVLVAHCMCIPFLTRLLKLMTGAAGRSKL